MTAQRRGIDNTPGAGEIKSLGDLCYEVLEPLRAHFDKPVTITSGYRSEALCEAIGSSKRLRSMRKRAGRRPRNFWRAKYSNSLLATK